MKIQKDSRIVFIGDSVTDDGRARPIGEGIWNGTGNGYVAYVETVLALDYPNLNIRCTNMGVSGNTSRDLLTRWDADVTALEPDAVVICIGINDVWRQFDMPNIPEASVLPNEFENNLEKMIEKTTASIFMMTPYFLEPNKNDPMRKRVDEYGEIVKKIAKKHGLPCIDLQAEFDRVLITRNAMSITWDRVHPGRLGSVVIARAILREFGCTD